MCSISGATRKEEVYKMIQTQFHRGPDDEGVAILESENREFFTLGMGRLSILDLASDNLCPHITDDGYALSYNGEIYNYVELKRELEALGHKFKTTSDTEVVLVAYRQWGTDAFNRFNGMFALAIYDPSKNLIILARDIIGQKPLFYRTDSSFAFASEAKALVNGNSEQIEDTFFEVMEHIYEGTLWSNIKQLPAAHYLEYSFSSKTYKTHRYWEFTPRHINEGTAIEELDGLLGDAVNLTKRSDVGYGLYYSGGIDSGLINSYLTEADHITYEDSQASQSQFEKDIRDVVKHLDFPVGSFSSQALYTLAGMASKRKYKVIISGEGADEAFGGYIRYVPVAMDYAIRQRYPSYRDMFDKTKGAHYADITNRHPKGLDYVAGLMDPFFKKYDAVTAMQLFDLTYVFPSLLQMGDRMAMAFGIENRCPFLDRRLIEFGLSLPHHMKIHNLETKVLLRQLAEIRGVSDVNTEKKGLIVPYNKWYGVESFTNRRPYFELQKKLWREMHA